MEVLYLTGNPSESFSERDVSRDVSHSPQAFSVRILPLHSPCRGSSRGRPDAPVSRAKVIAGYLVPLRLAKRLYRVCECSQPC